MSSTLEKLITQTSVLLERYEGAILLLEKKSDDYSIKLANATKESIALLKKEIEVLDVDATINTLNEASGKTIEALAVKSNEITTEMEKKLQNLDVEQVIKDFKTEADKIIVNIKKEVEDANVKAFDYKEVGKPTIEVNPTNVDTTWLDLKTGVVWVCLDITKDKNKWVSSVGSVQKFSVGKVDIFNDGSCIFYTPFNNSTSELTGSYITKLSGNLKQTEDGLLNDSKNNTNAINFKGLNLPDEFSFSAFLQEIEFENDPYSTPLQFEPVQAGLFFGNRTNVKGKRTISFSCGNNGIGDGYVEIDEGKKSFVVVNVKSFVTQDGNGNDINNFKITGYLNGEKVAENVYKNKSVLNGSTTQRVLLFQESDGTDDNGWDKSFDASQCFIGYIKNFRIFNRLLTDDEAKTLSEEV